MTSTAAVMIGAPSLAALIFHSLHSLARLARPPGRLKQSGKDCEQSQGDNQLPPKLKAKIPENCVIWQIYTANLWPAPCNYPGKAGIEVPAQALIAASQGVV